MVFLIDAVDAECGIGQDCEGVFSEIHKMWKDIARIYVATNALQRTPDSR